MEDWLQQWLSLLLRWAHFIVGIAWIGASFYFNWLENHLQRRVSVDEAKADEPASPGPVESSAGDPIAGDLWAVHGGGFYYLQKYRVAPESLPRPLHWFKYEAYFTWISGIALLAVVYYWNARLFMLDPAVAAITPTQAIALGLASLLGSWWIYDGLCRSPLRNFPQWLGILIFAWFAALAWLLGEFLSGRAAYIHVGAAIGTVMVANVFFVIIPSQKDLVDALKEGRPPDGEKGERALLRSRHNNYLTLPVLFLMISIHYPMSYGGPHPWLFLVVFSLAAVGIRHWFNIRHLEHPNHWILSLSVVLLLGLMLANMPRPAPKAERQESAPSTAEILPIISERCAGCHAAQPTLAGFTSPPLGVLLETAQEVDQQAERIYQTAAVTRTMPLGNFSGMTEAERKRLAEWYAGRSKGNPKGDN